ncbi:MAG: flagellar filament protein FlaA [Spirochaetales bacterium]|nr:flagellar filament protein FlaA [Spirochaetales bacterium]MBP7263003.1 flagellar filament protein FlaA [Spirochaetia bacterium]
MKKIFVVVLAFALAGLAAAQDTVGTPDADSIGNDTAQQKLQMVSVDKFESAGFWNAYISPDEGFIQSRLFVGSPAGKAEEPAPEERYTGIDPKIADQYSFGVRVDFFRRGFNQVYVLAQKPIPIEGISKIVSVWVAGRNYNHVLKLIVVDAFNKQFELTLGKLNFQGWKKLSVAIPPQNPDGVSGIIQSNYHYNNQRGIKIIGFKIECDPWESFGTYYIYFDDLRAITDLFAEDSRDVDDMVDGW